MRSLTPIFSVRNYLKLLAVLVQLTPLSSSPIQAQDNYIRSYLSVSDGLSQNEVTSICKDKYGFLWFGTRGGLNRYDGYEFKHFKPARDKESSIHNPSVECLSADREGKIWIGTKSGGFSIYDLKKETFRHSSEISDSIPERIISFLEDNEGGYWIGSFNDGFACFDDEKGNYERLTWSEIITSIVQTKDSTIWFGANGALIYRTKDGNYHRYNFRDKTYTITEIVVDPEKPYLWLVGWGLHLVRFNYEDFSFKSFSLPQNDEEPINMYSLLHDGENSLWIGTWGGGLFRFNISDETYEKIEINPYPEISTATDYSIILDIFREEGGTIWIGTDGAGIISLSPASRFNTLSTFSRNANFHYTSIYYDESDGLILGTRGNGLFRTTDWKTLESIDIEDTDYVSYLEEQNVYSMSKDSHGKLWVGLDQGVFILDYKGIDTPALKNASVFWKSPSLAFPEKVLSILHRDSELWLGTQREGLYLYLRGLHGYELQQQFTASDNEGGLSNNRISTLLTDRQDQLWVGTYNGMYKYKPDDGSFIPLKELIQDEKFPLCSIILCAISDRENNLWLGTPCSLNKLAPLGDGMYESTEFTKEDGLPDDYISNILEDNKGDIWITTNAGISKLELESAEFYNYEKSDGTGDYSYSESSSFKYRDGSLFFGGFSDLTYFQPKEIINTEAIPPLAITRLKILNSEISVSENGLLPVSINELDELELTFREKEVSVEFAALDFKSPEQNLYEFKLEKDDETSDWIYLGKQRIISLRNLSPGKYTLHMRGSNSNGIWNWEGRKLKITMKTPPWKSWYALSAYIILILVIFGSIVIVSIRQERFKNEAHVELVKREQEHQLHEYKLRFFTNISHEFRTPLSLILAPISELVRKDLSTMDGDIAKKITTIHKNSLHLMKLVTQLLEFRKIEAGKAKLKAGEYLILKFLEEICEPFQDLANYKKVKFKTEYKLTNQKLFIDVPKLSVVMNNLLSNAFKYCDDPGVVMLRVTETDAEVQIRLSNNGKGIASGDVDHVFDRFYQISSKKFHESSGIGLALVMNYVELHKGSITVSSIPGEITHFTVVLKKGAAHLSPEELSTEQGIAATRENFFFDKGDEEKRIKFFHRGTKGARILLVEDNKDVKEYIEDLLSEYYEVHTAGNGKEGFEQALELKPDLLISDVMMPMMDGYELCDRIKKHETLSHTPVILLTAKDTEADRLFGIKRGADDYIFKPFDAEFILEKIYQILSSHKNLADRFSKKITLEPENKEITPEAEKILSAAMDFIEKNISNQDLKLDDLASQLAMSPTTLYRKLKQLSNQSPGEFIRSVRFKRAAQLLRDSDLTISEITEMVGYRNIKRFREGFKNEYGLSPSEYRDNSDKQG